MRKSILLVHSGPFLGTKREENSFKICILSLLIIISVFSTFYLAIAVLVGNGHWLNGLPHPTMKTICINGLQMYLRKMSIMILTDTVVNDVG